MPAWNTTDRHAALDRCSREGVELLVIGGGINGAGVARDAAQRGLRTLLVERDDFASGTSGASSKLLHGGLRYVAQLNLGLAREASRERELLMRLNPNLVKPLPFLILDEKGAGARARMTIGLRVYGWLARAGASSRMVDADAIREWCPPLGVDVPRVGHTQEAWIDDARLVLETIKNARRHGAEAASQCEVLGFLYDETGRINGVRLQDRIRQRSLRVDAHHVVNTSGPAVDQIRALDGTRQPTLRPSRGTHVVLPRSLLPLHAAVAFRAADDRFVFAYPRGDAVIVGTTDHFADPDDLRPWTSEGQYLLNALNRVFAPRCFSTADVWSAWTGIRPLVSSDGEDRPSACSRESRITMDRSGLISMAGGKLTTYRLVAEQIVDRVVAELPKARRSQLGASRTAVEPLRDDTFEAGELRHELGARFGIADALADRLISSWGIHASTLLARYGERGRQFIGETDSLLAEVAWAAETEAPNRLRDLLERRVRLAFFTPNGCASHAADIGELVAPLMGWDRATTGEEVRDYRHRVNRFFSVHQHAEPSQAPPRERLFSGVAAVESSEDGAAQSIREIERLA